MSAPAAPARRGGGSGLVAAAGMIAVVTLGARLIGFGRWFVFSHSVGTTCVGNLYQAVNTLPNVVYEVAAGGALAAVVVPIIAGQLGRADTDAADRTASATLTWAVTALLPLTVLLAVLAGPISGLLLDARACAGSQALAASMLVVFAPQVVLYGVGIVLAGILQSHRRFLGAALAPLLSSLVVIGVYLGYGVLSRGMSNDLGRLPASATWLLAGGTTLGVVALSLPLLLPVRRAGVRLRPTWRFPPGVARRAGTLAGAGVVALLAQQFTVLSTIWVSNHRGVVGTLNVYTYVQAVYLLPYAVLAVPVATSAFPALASGAARDVAAVRATAITLARSGRAIVVAMCAGVAVLVGVAGPVGGFFTALDNGRSSPVGQASLGAMSAAVVAFAPGLVGYGLTAMLTRALYVRGHPAVAAGSVATGWLVAGAVPLLVLRSGSDARATLLTLGAASTAGMTVAALALAVAVRRAWGAHVFDGFGRTLAAAAAGAALGGLTGWWVSGALSARGLLPTLGAAAVCAVAALAVFLGLTLAGDPAALRLLRSGIARRGRPAL